MSTHRCTSSYVLFSCFYCYYCFSFFFINFFNFLFIKKKLYERFFCRVIYRDDFKDYITDIAWQTLTGDALTDWQVPFHPLPSLTQPRRSRSTSPFFLSTSSSLVFRQDLIFMLLRKAYKDSDLGTVCRMVIVLSLVFVIWWLIGTFWF